MNGGHYRPRQRSSSLLRRSSSEYPGNTIAVKTESLRFLGADSAIEEGTTTINNPPTTSEPSGSTETTRYSVAYVRREGKWLQDSIRDYPLPESALEVTAHEHLQELEWLIGEWVDESDDAEVHTNCRWSENQCFLLRSFQVRIRGKAAAFRLSANRLGSSAQADSVLGIRLRRGLFREFLVA